jgi:hypothetical protein
MKSGWVILVSPLSVIIPGADPGFQVSGGRAEGGAKMLGVFRWKNHDFTPKNHYFFSNFRGGGGEGRRVRPPEYDHVYRFCFFLRFFYFICHDNIDIT